MEEVLGPEPTPVLPNDIVTETHEWLRNSSSEEIIIRIYEQYVTAHSYDLVGPIMEYSDNFEYNDEPMEGHGPRVFKLGMLFGISVAEKWLSEKEWKCAKTVIKAVDDEYGMYNDTAADEDNPLPNWSDVLIRYGEDGLDLVSGYRELVEACMWKIERQDRLHRHFMAGAGFMLRIVLAARHQYRDQEIAELNNLFKKSGPRVARNAGGLAISETPMRQRIIRKSHKDAVPPESLNPNN